VLVTSRNPAWFQLAEPIEVDVLTRQESIALLLQHVPRLDCAAADRIADKLGDPAAGDRAGRRRVCPPSSHVVSQTADRALGRAGQTGHPVDSDLRPRTSQHERETALSSRIK